MCPIATGMITNSPGASSSSPCTKDSDVITRDSDVITKDGDVITKDGDVITNYRKDPYRSYRRGTIRHDVVKAECSNQDKPTGDDACTSNPCLHGGSCILSKESPGYSCICLEGYGGDTCQDTQGNHDFRICPANWKQFGHKCYMNIDAKLNWTNHVQHCMTNFSFNASLLVIESKEEDNFVSSTFDNTNHNDIWMGCARPRNADTWICVGNCASYGAETVGYWREVVYYDTYFTGHYETYDRFSSLFGMTEERMRFELCGGTTGMITNSTDASSSPPCTKDSDVITRDGDVITNYRKDPYRSYRRGTTRHDVVKAECSNQDKPTGDGACSSNPCLHGGSCILSKESPGYSCICLEGYGGHTCQETQDKPTGDDACSSNPCLHGGSCILSKEYPGYSCICVEGYGGDTCQDTQGNHDFRICPANWKQFGHKCYMNIDVKLNWSKHLKNCMTNFGFNASLLVIESKEEDNFVSNTFDNINHYDIWMGCVQTRNNDTWFCFGNNASYGAEIVGYWSRSTV
ncbi:neurogenic locus notch homolog protein 1-like [Lytechinus pictus]|uniref:neurogenic locus notch homolog protein 1-like n=1 Tax=Lytechinus pictus TaxID=7653 RepID=UPI0030B9FE6F